MIKDDDDDAYRKFSVMYQGGGIPYDMGGYYLHALFNILGPIEKVCGFSKTRNANRPYLNPKHSKFDESFFVNTPNTICASMQFKNGVFASLNISSEHSVSDNKFEIHGTQGILYIGDPNEFDNKVYIKKSGSEKLEFPISHPYTTDARGIAAADMAWALRTKRKPRLLFEMGYHTLEVINAITDCTKNGSVKTLKTDFDRPIPISAEYYTGGSEERSLFLY